MPMKSSDFIVATHSLHKAYRVGEEEVEVLKDVNLNVSRGEFVAICGPSGSGKTTLLNIISGIDRPTSGQILVLDQDLAVQDEDFLAEFRCSNVGFVFQSYNLVSTLTVAENVAFPMEWSRNSSMEMQTSAFSKRSVTCAPAGTTSAFLSNFRSLEQRVAFA